MRRVTQNPTKEVSIEETFVSTLLSEARDLQSPEPSVVRLFPDGIGGCDEALDMVFDGTALRAASE